MTPGFAAGSWKYHAYHPDSKIWVRFGAGKHRRYVNAHGNVWCCGGGGGLGLWCGGGVVMGNS